MILFAALAVAFSTSVLRFVTEGIPYGVGVPPERAVMTLLQGDHLQLFYHVQLLTRAVAGDAPWFTNPFEFATPHSDLGPYFYFFPLSLVFLIFSGFGDVAAYNALFLAATTLTGFTGFVIGRRLTGSGWAGLVAGAFMALVPYRMATAATGHPAGYYAPFLLLGALAVIPAWLERSRLWAALGGVSIFTVALYEPHYAYVLAGAGPVLFLAAIVDGADTGREGNEGFRIAVWGTLGFLLTTVLAGLSLAEYLHRNAGPLDGPATAGLAVVTGTVLTGLNVLLVRVVAALAGASSGRLLRRDLGWQFAWLLSFVEVVMPTLASGKILAAVAVGLWGLGKATLVPPGRLLRGLREAVRGRSGVLLWLAVPSGAGIVFLLWGLQGTLDATIVTGRGWSDVRLFAPALSDLGSRTSGSASAALYLGLAPWALVTLGVIGGLRSRHRAIVTTLAALFVAGLALSVGPALDPWAPFYRAAHALVPFFGFIRVSSKFFALVLIAATPLVAYGAAWLFRSVQPRVRAAATAALVVLIGADFSAYLPVGICLLPSGNEAYAHLRTGMEPGERFLAVPLWPGDSADASIYQYWAAKIRRPMVNGYSPAVPEAYREHVVWPLFDLNYGELREEEADLLKELRVRHLVFHQDVFPPKVSPFGYQETLRRLRAQPALEAVARDGPVFLFRLRDDVAAAPPSPVDSPLGVYYPAKHLSRRVGTFERSAETVSGHLVRAVSGESGFLTFGPYRSFPSGRFETLFRLRGDAGADGAVLIQVTAENGEKVLAEQRVDGELEAQEFQTFRLPWRLSRYGWIETRVLVRLPSGRDTFVDVDMALSQVRRRSAHLEHGSFGANDLIQEVGTLVPDAAAVEGRALEATSGPGILARGPWRLVRAGEYRVCVRTASPGGSGAAGHLRIVDGRGQSRGEAVLPATDAYEETCETLSLEQEQVIEFQVRVSGNRSMRFDRLTVTRTDPEAPGSGDAGSPRPPG